MLQSLLNLFGEYPDPKFTGKAAVVKRHKVHLKIAALLAAILLAGWLILLNLPKPQTVTANYTVVGSSSDYYMGQELFANLHVIDDYLARWECAVDHIMIVAKKPGIGLNGEINYDVSSTGEIGLLDATAANIPNMRPPDMEWLLAHAMTHACGGLEVFYTQSYGVVNNPTEFITGAFALAFVSEIEPTGQQTFITPITEASSDWLAGQLLGRTIVGFDPYFRIRTVFDGLMIAGPISSEQVASWNANSDPLGLTAAVWMIEETEVNAGDINVLLLVLSLAEQGKLQEALNVFNYYKVNGTWPFTDMPEPVTRN